MGEGGGVIVDIPVNVLPVLGTCMGCVCNPGRWCGCNAVRNVDVRTTRGGVVCKAVYICNVLGLNEAAEVIFMGSEFYRHLLFFPQPLPYISEVWHQPLPDSWGCKDPREQRDPTSWGQVRPLRIFKTLHCINVDRALSPSPVIFDVFCLRFNALHKRRKSGAGRGGGTELGITLKTQAMHHADWRTLQRKASKNNLEASVWRGATVQELSTRQWHRGLR